MSYNKRTWATGNVVGAVDLNRMEQGIEDSRGVLVVNSIYDSENDSVTLDKTWQEIYDAFPFVVEYYNENGFESKSIIHQVGNNGGTYFVKGVDDPPYVTTSASGYPATSTNSGGDIHQ